MLLKLVPATTTVAPTAPLVGLKPVMEGVANTVKSDKLATVMPLVVIEIGPVVAPAGTVVVIEVAFAEETTAVMPLNFTVGEALKFVPEIITDAPTAPLPGVKFEIVGVASKLKLAELKIVMPLVVTEIFPVVAPLGTKATMLEAVEEVTVAETSLNKTIGDGPKLFPLIVMLAPTAAPEGVNPEMPGVGNTVNTSLVMVTPLTFKVMGPELAPAGTVVATLLVVKDVKAAAVPLNETVGVVSRFVPERVTTAPTAPLVGLIPVIEGEASTVKLEPLGTVTPFTVIEIGPVSAPTGTLVTMLLVVNEFTIAEVPLNETVGVVLKFVPVMVSIAPTAPLDVLNAVMVGVPNTVKLFVLFTVTPFKVMDICPEVAPSGTVVVMAFAVALVTLAMVLLNVIILSVGLILKFVPLIVITAPTAPLIGVKLVMVGNASTVKLVALVIVIPLLVTDIAPVVAPDGTDVVMLVASEAVTVATVPLNFTMGEAPKSVPLIVTSVPGAPLSGVNELMAGVGKTTKFELLIVTPFKVKEIGPVLAPTGTEVVMVVVVEAVTTAAVPLNETTLSEGVALKLLPERIMTAPSAPLPGLMDVIDGVANTVKLFSLAIVTPFRVTDIFPVVAPAGTEVVMLVAVEAETTAVVVLNLTTWSSGLLLKSIPLIVTLTPTAPLVGENDSMMGVGSIVKLDALDMVTPLVVMEIGPVVAPTGMLAVMLVEFDVVTLALIPLKNTVGDALKFVPVIVTLAPMAPAEGLKLVMVGV